MVLDPGDCFQIWSDGHGSTDECLQYHWPTYEELRWFKENRHYKENYKYEGTAEVGGTHDEKIEARDSHTHEKGRQKMQVRTVGN